MIARIRSVASASARLRVAGIVGLLSWTGVAAGQAAPPGIPAPLEGPAIVDLGPCAQWLVIEGECRLATRSAWHDLDVPLTYRRMGWTPVRTLPFDAFDDHTRAWSAQGEALTPLVEVIQAAAWSPEDDGQGAFERWLGIEPRVRVRAIEGQLIVRPVEDAGEAAMLRIEGVITSTERGRFGMRFGPNEYLDLWRHEVAGQILLDDDHRPVAVELTSEFQVDGWFFTRDARVASERNLRRGRVTLNGRRLDALHSEQAARLPALVERLSAPLFAEREAAQMELAAMGPQIVPALKQLQDQTLDPEQRVKLSALIRDLTPPATAEGAPEQVATAHAAL